MMNCLICSQAKVVDGLSSVKFERNEIYFVINNVPARVCLSCREAYVEEDVAVQLLRYAEEMFVAGIPEASYEYATP